MKNITYKIISKAFVIGILSLTISCNDYLDINKSPNTVSDPDPTFTLTAAQVDIANFMSDAYGLAASFWVQYVTQAGNVAGFDQRDQYDITPGNNAYQRDYTGIYSGPLQDLVYTEEKATELGDENTAAVAIILKAYTFQVLVDMFDEIPYSQALKINEFSAPIYDGGETVYDDLIIKLDEAIARIDNTGTINGDLIFGGDMGQWLKFANTLKLKIFMRQTEARAALAESGVRALDGADFLGSGDDAEIQYDQANPANRHPAEVTDLANESFNAASATIVDPMVAMGDPRVDIFFRRPVSPTPAPGTQNAHKAVVQASGPTLGGPTAALQFYTGRNNFLIAEGAAFPYFSAAEIFFLRAEGVLRGWLSGDAQALYESGIKESFARTGAEGVDDFIINKAPFPAAGTFDEKLEAIMFQKWIALAGRQSIEMWAEWRRTGYPGTDVISVSTSSILPAGEFPLRFPLTQREIDLNTNVPSPLPLNTPVWWDK